MATWDVTLPSDSHAVGDPGHTEDHNLIVQAIEEVRTNVDASVESVNGETGVVALTASDIPATSELSTLEVITGLEAAVGLAQDTATWAGVSGKPATFPPALPVGTAAQLEAGTDTAARSWSAAVINAEIARQIAAIAP